jgi:hypothetical protein
MLRKLKPHEVEYVVEAHEESVPVRGNVLASGDSQLDKEAEDDVNERLNKGEPWAWCCVHVEAKWRGFVGRDTLGGCSYHSEKDFRLGPYFEDMCQVALEDLNEQVEQAAEELSELEVGG